MLWGLAGYAFGLGLLVAIPFVSFAMARSLEEARGWIMLLLYVLCIMGLVHVFGWPELPDY